METVIEEAVERWQLRPTPFTINKRTCVKMWIMYEFLFAIEVNFTANFPIGGIFVVQFHRRHFRRLADFYFE